MSSAKELLDRAKRIGIPYAHLAAAAHLHPQTVKNLCRDRKRGPGMTTVRVVERIVEDRELALLDDFLPRHLNSRLDRIVELLRSHGFDVERRAA